MMDMMVREVRAVTKGPLKIIRFGSCGSIKIDFKSLTSIISIMLYALNTYYSMPSK